jgi:type II secretory pathway pseudopilin PulG
MRRSFPRSRQAGASLLETLFLLAALCIVLLVTFPAFGNLRRRNAVRTAAITLRSVFRDTRSRAIARGRSYGVKFARTGAGPWRYSIYEDTNGNGVLNSEITRGVDVRVDGPFDVEQGSGLASIGLPPYTILDPDGDELEAGHSPVVFNNSTLCSFSPLGAATAGSIYITDDAGDLWALRVHAAGSRIRLLRYDAAARRWHE